MYLIFIWENLKTRGNSSCRGLSTQEPIVVWFLEVLVFQTNGDDNTIKQLNRGEFLKRFSFN